MSYSPLKEMVLPSFITHERLMCTSPQEWSFISNKASSMMLYRALLSKNRQCCLPKASHSALLTKLQNKQTSCPLVKRLHPSHKSRWRPRERNQNDTSPARLSHISAHLIQSSLLSELVGQILFIFKG